MKKIFAQDKGTFEVTERGDGFLKGTVSVSRLGVFDYHIAGEDGTPQLVKKAKLPEDLFSQANQDSIHLAPVTDGHPQDANGKHITVDKFNAGDLIKGTTSDPRIDGDVLKADEVIYDARLIEEVESGKKAEVSIGFVFEEEEKSSAYGDEKYDAIQRNIVTNHIAHVEAGRAGPECRFHIDMKEEGIMLTWRTRDKKDVKIDADTASVIHGELTHYKTAADGAEGKLTAAGEDATKLQTEIDKLKGEIADLKKQPAGDEAGKVAKLEGEKTTLQDKIDTLTTKLAAVEGDLAKVTTAEPKLQQDRVDRRVKLQADAEAFDIEDCTGMTDRQVMEQVVQTGDLKYGEGVDISAKTDEAIVDRYEATVDRKREQMNSVPPPGSDQKPSGAVDAEIKDNKATRLNMVKEKKGGSA